MKTLLLTSCLVAALAGVAQGATIAYEPVAYPPGALLLNGPAFGFAGPWIADTAVLVTGPFPGLSHPLALGSTGNKVEGFFNYIDPLAAPIAPTPGKEFWASFLLFHSGPNDQSFMGLGPPGAVLGDLPSVAIGVRLGQYGIFLGGTFTPDALVPFTPNGTTDFLVAHFEESGGVWKVSLFVNQPPFTAPTLVVFAPGTTFGTMVNQNQAQFAADEFRLGDTAADVAAGVVPTGSATWGQLKARYR
jgi:hypothetical protein